MPAIVYKSDIIDPARSRVVSFESLTPNSQAGDLTLTALALGGHPAGQSFSRQLGYDYEKLATRWRHASSLPFNSTHKYQAHLHSHPTAATSFLFVSGAPEILLEKSSVAADSNGHFTTLTSQRRQQLFQAINALAGQHHLVGMAVRRHLNTNKLTRAHLSNLTLLGVLLITEHLRPDLPTNIEKLFTGDHPASAAALARRLGLVANPDVHLSAEELDYLADRELIPLLPHIKVFSRLDPLHIQRLNRLYDTA